MNQREIKKKSINRSDFKIENLKRIEENSALKKNVMNQLVVT